MDVAAANLNLPEATRSSSRFVHKTFGSDGITWPQRLACGFIGLVCAVLLGTAYGLDANPQGMGTHMQLGLPSCGFLDATKLPCATCGMTTAFSHAAHGRLLSAFHTQPAGAVLALLATATLLVTAYAAIRGANLRPLTRRLWRPASIWLIGVLVLGAWVYKIVLTFGVPTP